MITVNNLLYGVFNKKYLTHLVIKYQFKNVILSNNILTNAFNFIIFNLINSLINNKMF